MSPEQARVFAKDSCDGDLGLLRELEELLDAAERPAVERSKLPLLGRFQSVIAASSGPVETHRAKLNSLFDFLQRHPHEMSEYDDLTEVARGGMGVVWKVWDRALHRELAMKRLSLPAPIQSPDSAPSNLWRFLREAHITGQLNHPAIPSVHKLGLSKLGELFFTMDLVQGESLDCVLQDSSFRRSTLVLQKASEAAGYAHLRQVIHRDISPRNIMVGSQGMVHLVDWGLARSLGSALGPEDALEPGDANEIANLTASGSILGTPWYISPEQAAGCTEDMDARSDVYMLGAVLYEILTGAPPFQKEYKDPPSVRELCSRIQSKPPHSPTPGSFQGSQELFAICAKAMAFDPDERYLDGTCMAADLDAWLGGRPVNAYRGGPVYRVSKLIQRRPKSSLGIMAALVGALLLTVLGGALIRSKNDRIVEEKASSDALAGFALDLFEAANPLAEGGPDLRVYDMLKQTGSDLSRLDPFPLAKAKLQNSMARAYLSLGQTDEAEPLALASLSWASQFLPTDDHVEFLRTRALLDAHRGNHEAAQRTYADLEANLLASTPNPSRELLELQLEASNNLLMANSVQEAESKLRAMLDSSTQVFGPTDKLSLLCARTLAGAMISLGHLREAHQLLEVTIPMLESSYGRTHINTLFAINLQANTLGKLGENDEAQTITLQLLDELEATYGSRSPFARSIQNNLATSYQETGRYDLARPIQEEVLVAAQQIYGPRGANTLAAMSNLALTYTRTNMFDEAVPLYKEAYAGRLALYGADGEATIDTLGNWGLNDAFAGRPEEALDKFERAHDACEKTLGRLHYATMRTLKTRATHLRNMGRLEEAEPYFVDALARKAEFFGKDHPETWATADGLITLYELKNDLPAALALAKQAQEWNESSSDRLIEIQALILRLEGQLR